MQTRPLIRAFLWGLASAAALPPVHLLPVLLFTRPRPSAPDRQRQASTKRAALTGWVFGFGLGLGGLYWITEPILTEASTFWWLVPLAAPLLVLAVAFYTIIPGAGGAADGAPLARPLLVFSGAWVLSNLPSNSAFPAFPGISGARAGPFPAGSAIFSFSRPPFSAYTA